MPYIKKTMTTKQELDQYKVDNLKSLSDSELKKLYRQAEKRVDAFQTAVAMAGAEEVRRELREVAPTGTEAAIYEYRENWPSDEEDLGAFFYYVLVGFLLKDGQVKPAENYVEPSEIMPGPFGILGEWTGEGSHDDGDLLYL